MKTKNIPILSLIFGFFILTMAFALAHGGGKPVAEPGSVMTPFIKPIQMVTFGFFAELFATLTGFFGQRLFWSVVALALMIELFLLYPSVAIQLKQKKIHLFHKKLVDKFNSGKLAFSKNKQELDVLYSVNETLHRRGALLFIIQLLVFGWVILGLQALTLARPENWSALSRFDLILLNEPASYLLPFSLALAYFLHSFIKIQYKQKQDYLNPWQSRLSLFIAVAFSALVFVFSSFMPVLLSVYMIHLITFSTLRYSIVEWNSKKWGKAAHRDLVKMIKHAKPQTTAFQKWRTKLNHSSFFRHFNLHLLEEAASMSLVVGLVVKLF